MSNPYYPGGPQQPPDPFRPRGPQPPHGFAGPSYPGPQYGAPQQYGGAQPYGAPYGSPPPRSGGRGGTASAVFGMLVLLVCAGIAGAAAFAGREGGSGSEIRAYLVQAVFGTYLFGDTRTLDDVETIVDITWALAVVAVVLALLLAAIPRPAIGAITGVVALLVGGYYAFALIELADELQTAREFGYLDDEFKYYVAPAAAMAAWFLAALFAFLAAAGRARRRPVRY